MSFSAATSRSNSIEITAETTLNQLRGLDFSDASGTTSSRRRAQQEMGKSLNFLNLDRRTSINDISNSKKTTVGGASPRLRLMQNRIRRLKKNNHTVERLYASDSALFRNTKGDDTEVQRDVWFKSLYPKQGALEKLDEAEQEYEDSQNNSEADDLHMSGTDLWLFEANQSAPGFLPGEAPKLEELEDSEDSQSHVRR
ncbi:expressed unknown protein [Seminavis robusta]|uniref:Uncharacterized protein n=1 Tax=Seminavis robusta TaxID=568900 RepID=A0A9N8DBU1_9STRA|nr:expressed unknown protein [Seminavis robusta]|eukprot:Sro27_g018360.1 n/a (198) ;mRNA; f:138684-139277